MESTLTAQSALNGLNVRINHVCTIYRFLFAYDNSRLICNKQWCEHLSLSPDWVNLNLPCQLVKHKCKPIECISCLYLLLCSPTSWDAAILGICVPLLSMIPFFLSVSWDAAPFSFMGIFAGNFNGSVNKTHYGYLSIGTHHIKSHRFT